MSTVRFVGIGMKGFGVCLVSLEFGLQVVFFFLFFLRAEGPLIIAG